ncbi:acetate--CoA ligase [Myxococcota bacterium]|nr:acetate--CoA ligase [Myxococcota bacterium]MBU1432597.1 acetate--CoA ligase [Myxococcota bacterium]MBU1896585.1 acetate--CoA ligase [Myxococcota bacterium]
MAETYAPKPENLEDAHLAQFEEYARQYRQSLDSASWFWAEKARRLTWFHPWTTVLDADHDEADFAWFSGGRLNVCYNCVDRHIQDLADEPAVIWAADEPGRYERITYRQLKHRVGQLANVLKAHGVRRGDRVCLYMPMIPEVVYAMLACARIGAIHSVVFAGFSAEALRDRVLDADARIIVTADEGRRGGKFLPLKRIVDQAIAGTKIDAVLVARRTGRPVPMNPARDYWLDEEMSKQRTTCTVEWMGAEDPLFILYTSGSTGKPKGVLHTSGGYLVWAATTHHYVFDYRPGEVFFCAADVGWITGHSYIVYGPLANGGTTVLFESTPLYPDPSRYWQIVEDLEVTTLYTAPTALRALAREGDAHLQHHDRSSLRILGTVGEPINPEIWRWYHDKVGEGRCQVVDTWWQTETGGVMIAPLPPTHTKPGSATLPFFGVAPVLMSPEGEVLKGNGVEGALCISGTWPGQARTIWGDHRRFKETYYTTFPGYYFTGDGAKRDEDGYYWITGRIDDVINVSGHRLGTAEIESVLVEQPSVAEAAVVGYPHEIKGTGIYAYVLLSAEALSERPEELIGALKAAVRQRIGGIATPDCVHIASGLPKTRSGKIMRRLLRKIAAGERDGLGDLSTLAEPQIVEALISERAALRP